MITNKKSFTKLIVAFACVLSLCGYLLPAAIPAAADNKSAVYAHAAEQTADGYYYDNLSIANTSYELGKKFYAALNSMLASGDFKDGKISYSIDKIVTSAQLKAWVENGDLTVPKAFGAARDSFLMDHPELFYIDVYKIMISAGYSGGSYKGYIDCGREPNIYRDNAFESEADVDKAIAAYNAAVKKFADDAKTRLNEIASLYKSDCKLAIAANEEIAEKVKYDYAVLSDYEENGENAKSVASLAHTAYGALVNKKAVCSGYSFGYKAVLDYLGVPSIVVSGYSTGKNKNGENTSGNVPHSWNYVKLEVADKSADNKKAARDAAQDEQKAYDWFAFDTTWNGVSVIKNKYSAMNAEAAAEEHIPNPEISSSGYPMNYPSLSQASYAQAVDPAYQKIDIEQSGFACQKVCTSLGNVYAVEDYVSYNGKSSNELAASENLRIIQRQYYLKDGEKQWTQWQDLANSVKYKDYALGIDDLNGKTVVHTTSNVQYIQYAVVQDLQPDVDATNFGVTFEKLFYSSDEAVQSHKVIITEELENPVYGTYTPAPYLVTSQSTPISGTDVPINSGMSEAGNSSTVADSKAVYVKLVYDEPLHLLDPDKKIDIEVSAKKESALQHSGFAKFPDGEYAHLIKDGNGILNTVEFRFKPSLLFEHNRVGYTFNIKNVGSAKIVEKKNESGELVKTTSDRVPNSAYYVFSRIYITCPKVFGDGRLYVDCCAQPTLLDNSDLAATGFEDENGNSTFSEASRSQMMLVVNDVSAQTESDIINRIDADDANGINKSDVLKSQTYDINLQICGKYAKIPNGSYVRIALGFPEGYGPENEGVTFKIFHRKNTGGDNYEIEEIPCVVTKFGIVATVTSFSPYTVVVVPENKASSKNIVASIDGKGGTLSVKDGKILSIADGGSHTYNLTPNSGYQIYKVTLNGKDVTANVKENSFTVNYDDLANNNELEIKYISNEAKTLYAQKNIVDPVKIIIPVGADIYGIQSNPSASVRPKSNTGLIVGLVLGAIAVAGAVTFAFILVKRERTLATASDNGGSASAAKKNGSASAPKKNSTAATKKGGNAAAPKKSNKKR